MTDVKVAAACCLETSGILTVREAAEARHQIKSSREWLDTKPRVIRKIRDNEGW